MLHQAGPAHAHRFVELACTAVLFRKLRKSNRRRIPLDPASKFFNPLIVHEPYGTTTGVTVVEVRPRLSVTVYRTL
jgi:hypothetical protein